VALIVDLDGTVADNRHRQHLIPREKTQTHHWHAFNNTCDLDAPVTAVIDLIHLYMQMNPARALIFATSRTETARDKTERFLAQYFEGYGYQLLMRPVDDHRSAVDIKAEWLDNLAPLITDNSVFLEDNRDVHNMAKQRFPNASHLLVPSFDCAYLALTN